MRVVEAKVKRGGKGKKEKLNQTDRMGLMLNESVTEGSNMTHDATFQSSGLKNQAKNKKSKMGRDQDKYKMESELAISKNGIIGAAGTSSNSESNSKSD